ncbi:MAG: YkgJ family cysteine cluster protein [Desulfobulbaceae bacterium]|nr:YkgJ family cysteine cluster protein [Desulfobulbaceae bacterium]
MTASQDFDQDSDFIKGTDKNPSNIVPEKLTFDSYLKFECHPGVSCFTSCCHNIKIILTPYDILILRKRLGLIAHEFIAQYTQPTFLEKTDMPGVQIKLTEDKQACPFVTPEGCRVYSDRPTACRYYPVGMADFHEGGSDDAEKENAEKVTTEEEKFFFIIREPHCKGFDEPKEWTIREWRVDQGVDVRDELNKEWLRLIMRRKSFGYQATLSEGAQRMFFMASTDLDSFRKFIFESSFLDTYIVDEETRKKIKEDDVELMLFSFKYLANTLFGAEGMDIDPEKVQVKVEEIKKRQDESLLQAERDYHELKAERERLKKEQQAEILKKNSGQ